MVTVRPRGVIEPSVPTLAAKPPSGPSWVYEIKHDAYSAVLLPPDLWRRQLNRVGPAGLGLPSPRGSFADAMAAAMEARLS
jgi:hypothetical protein